MATINYIQCNICGTYNARFVRDHNHNTGMIRGILCEQCNSWLGVFVKNIYRKNQCGRTKYQNWVTEYQDKISIHLAANSGIRYSSKQKFEAFTKIFIRAKQAK